MSRFPCGLESGKKRQRGECGGADREALADGGGGVSDGVQFVSALADFLGQPAHFRDASGVVRDRAIGIDGELHAGIREHADCGDRDAIKSGEMVGCQDGGGQHENRQRGREHTDA